MKKKEIVTLALTTALLMTAHAVPASAASNAPESMSQTGSIQTITPRWESTNVVVPSISISGKQISVSVYISPKKSTTSSVGTLYLEKKVGNGWTPVTSWSIDGTGSVSITKTYTGTMGITYRTSSLFCYHCWAYFFQIFLKRFNSLFMLFFHTFNETI